MSDAIFRHSEAWATLCLIREGHYNIDRPSSQVIPELVEVIHLLADRIDEVEAKREES